MYYAVDTCPSSKVFKQKVGDGVKPLYAYKDGDGGWHFASKYKGGICHENVKKKDIWNNSQTFDQLSASLFLLRHGAIVPANLA